MREPLCQSAPLLTRINVTPIIDVALVLVIILLVTAPLLSAADLDVKLPIAHARNLGATPAVSITVAADGRLSVDESLLTDAAALTPYLQERQAALPKQNELLVIVRADAGVPHALVRNVLAAAQAGGATRLGIATRSPEGGRP